MLDSYRDGWSPAGPEEVEFGGPDEAFQTSGQRNDMGAGVCREGSGYLSTLRDVAEECSVCGRVEEWKTAGG